MTDEPDARRAFLAVALDGETRHLLGAHLREHLPRGVPGKAVAAENWHLTLRFLGRSRDDQLETVVHHIDERDRGGPFMVRFGALGAFPRPRRATVLWLGVAEGAGPLGSLASICEEAAVAAGFTPEDRPFHAHLTLSRLRPNQDVTAVIASVPSFDVRIAVEEITLFQSHLGRGGARYEPLEHLPL